MVEGGFNNQRRAVSLVSGANVIGVQASPTNPPGGQGTALLRLKRVLEVRLARLVKRSPAAGEAGALALSARALEAQAPGFTGRFLGNFIPDLLGKGRENKGQVK